MNNNKNNNPYGHLLDKYLDGAHFDYRTEEQKKEEERRAAGLLKEAEEAEERQKAFWIIPRRIIQYGMTCSVFMKAVRE